MPAFTATAPGKVILFGEHAVVYGEPAIAIPVLSLQARAVVSPVIAGNPGGISLEAPDIHLFASLDELDSDHPLRAAIAEVLGNRSLDDVPSCRIMISSTIPTSSGLGSGAAVSVALIRAFSAFLGQRLSDEQVSQLAFEVEKIHHGTPSGIDNTVIAYQKPIYYQKGEPFHFLSIPTPFSILIASCGKPGNTLRAVQQVRDLWDHDRERINSVFSSIGEITRKARDLIQSGLPGKLGPLMDQNHELLKELGVSTPELDLLVRAAKGAGALGAKLSGGGLGGHIIVLAQDQLETIAEELIHAGASTTQITAVLSTPVVD